MYIDNITSIKRSIMNRKSYTHPFNLGAIFKLLTEKSPEIFPKIMGSFFISESFALNLIYFHCIYK